jgi:hypothetical protein
MFTVLINKDQSLSLFYKAVELFTTDEWPDVLYHVRDHKKLYVVVAK